MNTIKLITNAANKYSNISPMSILVLEVREPIVRVKNGYIVRDYTVSTIAGAAKAAFIRANAPAAKSDHSASFIVLNIIFLPRFLFIVYL